jgi:hypothetical protein
MGSRAPYYDSRAYAGPSYSTARLPRQQAWLQDALTQDLPSQLDVPRSYRPPILPSTTYSRSSPTYAAPETGRRRGYTVPQARDMVSRDDADLHGRDMRLVRSQGNLRQPTTWARGADKESRARQQAQQEVWDAQTASTSSSNGKGKQYQVRFA